MLTGTRSLLVSRLISDMLEVGEVTKEQLMARMALAKKRSPRLIKELASEGSPEDSGGNRALHVERELRKMHELIEQKELAIQKQKEAEKQRKERLRHAPERLEAIRRKRWNNFLAQLNEKESMLYRPIKKDNLSKQVTHRSAFIMKILRIDLIIQEAIDNTMGLGPVVSRFRPRQSIDELVKIILQENTIPSLHALKKRFPRMFSSELAEVRKRVELIKRCYPRSP